MSAEPISVQMPMHDCVVLSDGREALILDDLTERVSFNTPVKRAVVVARLRAMADLIESPDPLDRTLRADYPRTT